MRLIILIISCIFVIAIEAHKVGDHCDVDNSDKYDCAPYQDACYAAGCCWVPVVRNNSDNTKDIPWCFYPSDMTHPPDPCEGDVFNWVASDPGFTDDIYNVMYQKYKANLNIDGTGAVVAAPDYETPGGPYYYHWMRDAGLSIKAWMDINDNDYETVREELEGYARWTGIVQHKPDPNDIDVRIEPKFTIEDQEPYTGGWCRPQTDGPALRAMALSKWGRILLENGKETEAKNTIWPLVSFDLEWVTTNWESQGCDLWEEVRSDDFFFNRMAYIYSLNQAADFADLIGESSASTIYRSVADVVATAITTHWNGNYLTESTNRPDDGAVIHAITTFGEYLYPANSQEAAGTIKYLVRAFCNEYPINQEDNAEGMPGILIGRYPNDSYAGGNPWQLLTAVLAECFYIGASITLKLVKDLGNYQLTVADNGAWLDLLNLEEGATARDLATAQISAGDAVMTRLWNHVKADGGKIDEQIDKYTGVQASAEALTWSYANILHALHIRKDLNPGDTPTNPPSDTTTQSPGQTCCRDVKFESTGIISQNKPGLLGTYTTSDTDLTGRTVYQQVGGSMYLHYAQDPVHHFESWVFSSSSSDLIGEVINTDTNSCVDATSSTWEILLNNAWETDSSAKVSCEASACCSSITLASTGGIGTTYPEILGTYNQDFSRSGSRPSYYKSDGWHLHYLDDVAHHFSGWTVSKSLTEVGVVTNMDQASDCAEVADSAGWEYNSGSSWILDSSFSVDCV